jgi:hypothetical protein
VEEQRHAVPSLVKAIEIARSQQAHLFELRAAVDLAPLWHDISANSDPRALLGPIRAMIEGGESARDVRNAGARLAECA